MASSWVEPPPPIPTLFTRTCRPPYCATAVVTAPCAVAASVMSPANTVASPPASSISRRSALARSSDRFTNTTLAPSRANSSAIAFPFPRPGAREAAPVTIATFPFMRPLISLCLGVQSCLQRFEAELELEHGLCKLADLQGERRGGVVRRWVGLRGRGPGLLRP